MPPLTLITTPPPPASATPRRGDDEIDDGTLARACAGDARACRALVSRYERRVFAVVGRTLGPRRAARVEDVCQETFLRVFRALPRFDPQGPARLSTWILTIALRLCFDELRKDRGDHADVDALADDLAAPNVTEPVLLERALRARVERAVDALPPDLRATFVLRVVGELSVDETARALDVDTGTVKSRLSRAREKLRAAVGEH